ncbi:hypothetical protein THRCLA_08983 [Thraustotheca clavata]|uniref:Uncharacterized protein n=1 Tax=Thraustotheca clavata TaxID=74557 RepID=A0A1V9Z111_9STRA|nr:hypothetical protein THRCLA_08983 [Thraustotheca clavata]
MVWGTKAGVTDLVQKLNANSTKSMYILSTRKVSSSDAISLATALKTNSTMEEFYISGHNLGDDGLQAFADVLAHNCVLRKLAVGTESLGDNGVRILCNGLGNNSNSKIESFDMELKSIGNDGASAMGEILAKNNSIRQLVVARNRIQTPGFEQLVLGLNASNYLEELDIAENNLTLLNEDGSNLVQWISKPNCSLKIVNIAGNPLGDSAVVFLKSLAINTSIESLNLSSTELTSAAWAALGYALSKNSTLKTLDLSQNTISSADEFITGVAQNKGLTRLVLAKTKLGDEVAKKLKAPSSLLHLDLSANNLTSIGMLPHLASPIQELRVFDNSLGNGVYDVLPTIVANPVLQSLDVGANGLHGKLSIALFEALHIPTALKTLEVGGNNLGDDGLAALEVLQERNPLLDVAIDKRGGNDTE